MRTNSWSPGRAEGSLYLVGAIRCLSIATALILTIGALPSSVIAQTPPPIEEGSRVRITAPTLDLVEAVGTIQQSTMEELVIRFERPERLATVARADITAMDVSVGTRRTIGKGIGIGFLIGAGSGALIGLASGDDQGGFVAFTAEEKALVAGLGLGVVGAVVGLIVGAANRQDVWAPAPGERSGLAIRPIAVNHHMGVSVGFAIPVGGGR